jgi:hypothetical protein
MSINPNKLLHVPLFPTPGAPITATLTSQSVLFFLRIPLIALDVMVKALGLDYIVDSSTCVSNYRYT